MHQQLSWIECSATNRKVGGSNPSWCTKQQKVIQTLNINVLYDFLHRLCKMHGTNIFTILHHPIGICARCIGSYISAAIILYTYLHKFKMDKIIFIIIGTLAFGEIAAEYFNLFVTNDFIRLIDGFFLGAFLGMLFIKILDWLEGKKGW